MWFDVVTAVHANIVYLLNLTAQMTWGRAKFELGSILTGKFAVLQQHVLEEYRKVGCNRVLADRWFKRMFKYLQAYDTGLDQAGAEASMRASKKLKSHERSPSSAAALGLDVIVGIIGKPVDDGAESA